MWVSTPAPHLVCKLVYREHCSLYFISKVMSHVSFVWLLFYTSLSKHTWLIINVSNRHTLIFYLFFTKKYTNLQYKRENDCAYIKISLWLNILSRGIRIYIWASLPLGALRQVGSHARATLQCGRACRCYYKHVNVNRLTVLLRETIVI